MDDLHHWITTTPLCPHHALVIHGLDGPHMDREGWESRVATIAAQCPGCITARSGGSRE